MEGFNIILTSRRINTMTWVFVECPCQFPVRQVRTFWWKYEKLLASRSILWWSMQCGWLHCEVVSSSGTLQVYLPTMGRTSCWYRTTFLACARMDTRKKSSAPYSKALGESIAQRQLSEIVDKMPSLVLWNNAKPNSHALGAIPAGAYLEWFSYAEQAPTVRTIISQHWQTIGRSLSLPPFFGKRSSIIELWWSWRTLRSFRGFYE